MTLSRRDALTRTAAVVAGAALMPRETVAAAADSEPVEISVTSALTPDQRGDYELTIFLDIDFQDYRTRDTIGRTTPTYGQYEVAAGRENGAWRMHVRQVLAEDAKSGEHIYGPALMDMRDQTAGPDPLALLQSLLGGQAVLDGSQVIRGLRPYELDALHAASPALQTDLLALMQRDWMVPGGDHARWFGRWLLTASVAELDGFFTTNPEHMALAARVRAENLSGKALEAELGRVRGELDMMERVAARDTSAAQAFMADQASMAD
jgi:hypothetical protein